MPGSPVVDRQVAGLGDQPMASMVADVVEDADGAVIGADGNGDQGEAHDINRHRLARPYLVGEQDRRPSICQHRTALGASPIRRRASDAAAGPGPRRSGAPRQPVPRLTDDRP